MIHNTSLPLFVLLTAGMAFGTSPVAAQSRPDPAGYWEGAITLPNTSLGIQVVIERGASSQWKGSISIPVQGLRNFGLTNITVRGADVTFAMPGIPGNPEFKGKLATDEKTITGDFTQGGQTLPFKLERKSAKPKQTAETPAKGAPGKGLAGVWQGSLKVSVVELRLVLKITKSGDGRLTGTMDTANRKSNLRTRRLESNSAVR